MPERIRYISQGVQKRVRRWRGQRVDELPVAPRLSFARTTAIIKEKAYAALRHYEPRPYAGTMGFVKNGQDQYFPADPIPVWSHLVERLEVESVYGDHLYMVTEDFEGLATALGRFVQKAL